MGHGRVAARLWMSAFAALVLLAALASQPGIADPAPSRAADGTETIGVLPFGEAPGLSTTQRPVGESFSGIDRSRPIPFAAVVLALGGLLAAALCWRASSNERRRRAFLSPLRLVAGPRAPPLLA
jgi:hypothetical protein